MNKQKNKNDNSNYKNKKRRLMLLILLFILLIFVCGFSTYAWFSSNKNALIDSIDINVATVTGLQVSADAITWDNEISKEELINAKNTYRLAENQFPDTLSGVSTVGNVTNGKMDIFYGIVSEATEGVYNLMSVTQTEMNCTGDEECVDKNYIAFDIFLLVTTPATIAITPTSNVIPTEGAVDKGSQNAARIGFVVEGTVNQNSEPYVAQSLRGGRDGLIWEPNYDRHTESGVEAAKEFYNITTQESGASRLPYKGINTEFGIPVLLTETHTSPYFSDVTPDIATTQTFMNSQVLTNIPAGITKMRIYLWLEGQDVDMENDAAASQLTFNLELAMVN